jgi:hypothetical protein
VLTVADTLRQHGPAYLDKHHDTMTVEQRRVLRHIMACRTGELGSAHYLCTRCGNSHWIPRCCGNRHCPSCQASKNAAWCERQLQRRLPCHYFLLTFTVPSELREQALRHPREFYGAMFDASSQALNALAADPRRLGAQRLGFFSALHTWGRDMSYHPHVHCLVPGGGLDGQGQWRSTPENFFLPCQPLSILYRNKMQAALSKAAWFGEVRPEVWQRSWVVDSQAVGDGAAAVKYLAPYVFRVAISDRRLVASNAREVTFRYRRRTSHRERTMTVSGEEFVRRFLLHVLPRGFQKVRHYGFSSPNSRYGWEEMQWIVAAAYGLLVWWACTQATTESAPQMVLCRRCGAPCVLLGFVNPPSRQRLNEPPTAQARPP